MGLFGRGDDDRERDDAPAPPAPPAQAHPPLPGGGGSGPNEVGDPAAAPPHQAERLRALAGAGGQSLWTSDLSIDELIAIRAAGFEPVGLVVGSSIYHIGLQNSSWGQNQELGVLTQATYHARELAMGRMVAEAGALNADGIVGVRLKIGRWDWGADLAEYLALGTAIRAKDGSSHRDVHGQPFTSGLSGQEFFKLRTAGLFPVGLAMGSCVYHVAHQSIRQAFRNMGRNVEMPNYTQALYDARELAMERMEAEARHKAASGIVGVTINEGSYGWGSHIIEFFATGTAVRDAPAIAAPPLHLTLPIG